MTFGLKWLTKGGEAIGFTNHRQRCTVLYPVARPCEYFGQTCTVQQQSCTFLLFQANNVIVVTYISALDQQSLFLLPRARLHLSPIPSFIHGRTLISTMYCEVLQGSLPAWLIAKETELHPPCLLHFTPSHFISRSKSFPTT